MKPTKGQSVRVFKPGMPDDGMRGQTNGDGGSEGVWVVGIYTSATWYNWEELQWDATSFAKSLVNWMRTLQ